MAAATRKPANGRAPKRAAEVAVAEIANTPIYGMFRGITITLPGRLPATFTLDLAEVQGKQNDLGPAYRLLVSILGEGQWSELRDKVAADDTGDGEAEGFAGVLGELIASVVGAYNMEPGESQASETS